MSEAATEAPPLTGLDENEARRRLAIFGPNRLTRRHRYKWIREIARTLADPMAMMLAATAAVYALLGERTNAVVMAAALGPVLGVDVILEARSRGALKRLAEASAPRARVVRGGIEQRLSSEQIVAGDILLVREGDVVAADAIVRSEANLSLDESPLTGKAEPKQKTTWEDEEAPEDSCIFAGSRVLTGHCCAEVTATGGRTRYGSIARLVAEREDRPTPLQRKTAVMVRWMVGAAVAAASALFAVMLARGDSPKRAFLFAISLAMSGVGEEFLLVLTLFLSLGAWRLGRIGVLVRRVASVETLGATTVICLDKTGTLTAGSYALSVVQPFGVTEHELLEFAVLACERKAVDAMEAAIVARAAEIGVDPGALAGRWTLVRDHPFDPVGKHMSHVWEAPEGSAIVERVAAKGSLEGVLEHCEIASAARAEAMKQNARLAREGMRVLAVAVREARLRAGWAGTTARQQDERGLTLTGLLGFRDPLRREVPAAVAECQAAGVTLKLLTGDHPLSPHAVADTAGIMHRHDGIITGDLLDLLTPDQFDAEARRCSIFARVRPEQKYALVDALSRSGEIVAMTGDGINDAPALRRADIGISMGAGATEVARAAANLVLLRDDFSSLEATIREGRALFANIQRAFRYLAGFKVMVVALALAAPLCGLPILLLPIDLVWLELIVHPVSALAFEDTSTDSRAMRRPPRRPDAPVLQPREVLRSALSGALLAAGTLAYYTLRLDHGVPEARGAALAVAWAGSLLLIWAELAGTRGWWSVTPPRSVRFWLVIALVAVSLPAIIATPTLAALLGISALAGRDWIGAAIVALAATAWRSAPTKSA